MTIKCDKKYTDALRRILNATDYVFYIKAMRGASDYVDPWYDYDSMKRCISRSANPCKNALALLQMGISAKYDELVSEIDEKDVELMIEAGVWRMRADKVGTNNLVAICYQGITVLTEINPWYKTCQNRNTDVYIGSDSLRLAENIAFNKGATVLDLCSGTGIQGILAARSAKKVVSVELNAKAVPVTRFNVSLNGLEDVIEIREGDLYEVVDEGEKFDFIYANPPFIPMISGVTYPICGAGGEDGLTVLNRIVEGLPKYLKTDGEAILFCECLGDEYRVFFDDKIEALGEKHGWRVNVLYNNRIIGEHQIPKMAALTKLFGEIDEAGFVRKMTDVYQELGAKFLYSLVYKIDVCGRFSMRRVNGYNPWSDCDRAYVTKGLELAPNKDSQAVMLDGSQIGAINLETVSILEQLRDGNTVRECADSLWVRYKDNPKYQKGGYPMFLNAMLNTCFKMESIGAITRMDKSELPN